MHSTLSVGAARFEFIYPRFFSRVVIHPNVRVFFLGIEVVPEVALPYRLSRYLMGSQKASIRNSSRKFRGYHPI